MNNVLREPGGEGPSIGELMLFFHLYTACARPKGGLVRDPNFLDVEIMLMIPQISEGRHDAVAALRGIKTSCVHHVRRRHVIELINPAGRLHIRQQTEAGSPPTKDECVNAIGEP